MQSWKMNSYSRTFEGDYSETRLIIFDLILDAHTRDRYILHPSTTSTDTQKGGHYSFQASSTGSCLGERTLEMEPPPSQIRVGKRALAHKKRKKKVIVVQ